jgi:hypothetical protein
VEGRDLGLTASAFRARLAGAMLAGAMLAALSAAVAGFLLAAIGRIQGSARATHVFREFLNAGGWLWIALWGAALAALVALPWASRTAQRVATVGIALALAALPLIFRPRVLEIERTEHPRTAREKARAVLRWSFRSPASVERIVSMSRDPDPGVREQAALALGVNLVVADIESSPLRPSRFAGLAVRDSIGDRLRDLLRNDPDPAVGAQSARALWKAPIAFGRVDAAAETLAAFLDRARDPRSLERLTWLALDAAAGAPHPALRAAAARFAATTSDRELARAARLALERGWQSPGDSGKKIGP